MLIIEEEYPSQGDDLTCCSRAGFGAEAASAVAGAETICAGCCCDAAFDTGAAAAAAAPGAEAIAAAPAFFPPFAGAAPLAAFTAAPSRAFIRLETSSPPLKLISPSPVAPYCQ